MDTTALIPVEIVPFGGPSSPLRAECACGALGRKLGAAYESLVDRPQAA